MLNRMKAEYSHVRNASNAAAAKLRAQRMASIFDDHQAVMVRNLVKFIEIRRMSSVVDRQQRFRARRDTFRNAFRINIQGVFANISEDRFSALIEDAVRGRRKRQRRRYGVIADSESSRK